MRAGSSVAVLLATIRPVGLYNGSVWILAVLDEFRAGVDALPVQPAFRSLAPLVESAA